MARDGVTCPTCGMTRAPSLPTCPGCRPAPTPGALRVDDGSGDERPSAFFSFPSRLVLMTVPIAWLALTWLVQSSEPWGSRSLGYIEQGWVSAAIAIALGTPILLAAFFVARRLLRGIRISGEAASPLAIGVAVVFALGPLVFRAISRPLEAANVDGIEAGPPRDAECVWTEVRHWLNGAGAVVHTALTAECRYPDGTPFTIDLEPESASVTEGSRVVVPVWRGRYWGRLMAHDADAVLHPTGMPSDGIYRVGDRTPE